MKFMKVGSRPDAFYTTKAIRYHMIRLHSSLTPHLNSQNDRSISSEVSSDLIVQVKDTRYLLHKFPLLSKSLRLQRMCSEAPGSSPSQSVHLPEFPGGEEAFELCAKFCYGITITISARNVVATRCAAEYLLMSEDAEKGNLIYKIDVFFSSCIIKGWRECIVTLITTRAFPLLSEDLGITGKCIEAIAAKVLANPSKVSLSNSRSVRVFDIVSCNGVEIQSHNNHRTASKGWWGEDIAELGIDIYWRTMVTIKSGGRVPLSLIGDALKIYASCWLPKVQRARRTDKGIVTVSDSDRNVETTLKDRVLLESIIGLLPAERGAVSCGFLSKLLKAANILGASSSSKMELARRFGIQLEEAMVKDLLIPPPSGMSETCYDVDTVMSIVMFFMLRGQSPPTSPPRLRPEFIERRRSRSAQNVNLQVQESRRSSSASHSSKLKVAKIVDGYLQEIGYDANLPLSKFIAVAEAVPDFARTDHDNLYRAIDIYLKAHPGLTKSERKWLCQILDCKKLSVEACMHAAQNEKLPLRVIVQVLFFVRARAAKSVREASDLPVDTKASLASHDIDLSRPPGPSTDKASSSIHAKDQWSMSGMKSPKRIPTLKMKLTVDNEHDDTGKEGNRKASKLSGICMIPGWTLGKFWSKNMRANVNANGNAIHKN